jgi:transposase
MYGTAESGSIKQAICKRMREPGGNFGTPSFFGTKTMARPHFATDISREEFEPVRAMLESARRKTRPRKHDLYDVFCAVLHLLDTGLAWRALPPQFPPWRTVHEYFTQWTMARGGQPSLLEEVLVRVGPAQAAEQVRRRIAEREA